jgi:arylsulfatase
MGHLENIVVPGHPGFLGKLAESSVTLAEVLREAGYFTAMTGKWHLGFDKGCSPASRGFDRSLNMARGGIHFSDQTGGKGPGNLYLNGEEKAPEDPMFGRWYAADLFTSWGLKFIDEAKGEGKPFFLYLAHVAPHFPLMAPKETIAKYRGKYLAGWDKLREERIRRQKEMGLIDPGWNPASREPDSPAWEAVPEGERDRFDQIMAIYAAMIDSVDRSIGDLVTGLKERGVLDNTLILFLSDNGGNAESGPDGRCEGDAPGGPHSTVFLGQNWATLANAPFRKFKHYVHEGGISTPLIAHWPRGIRASLNGSLVGDPGHLVDIMPTLVEVAGAAYPAESGGKAIDPMEGISLAPLFSGDGIARKSPIFFNHEDNRAVRDGRWKIVALAGKPWELYDMAADRTESRDLAAEQPERLAAMAAQYEEWAKRTRVVVEGVDRTWHPEKARGKKGKKK